MSVTSSNFWVIGAYIHAVATVSSTGAFAIYQNGGIVGTFSSGYCPTSMTRLDSWIGRSAYSNNDYLNAYVSYLRVYNSLALTATDVATLYAQRYDCNSGMYGISGSCTACPAGSYCASKGLSTISGVCSAGTYSAATSTVCSSCLAGYFQAIASSSSCSSCTAGSYCASTGLTSVTGSCSAGTYSANGAIGCTPCSSGRSLASYLFCREFLMSRNMLTTNADTPLPCLEHKKVSGS